MKRTLLIGKGRVRYSGVKHIYPILPVQGYSRLMRARSHGEGSDLHKKFIFYFCKVTSACWVPV